MNLYDHILNSTALQSVQNQGINNLDSSNCIYYNCSICIRWNIIFHKICEKII